MTYQEIIEKLVEWGADENEVAWLIDDSIENNGRERTLNIVSSWLIDPPIQTTENNKMSTLIANYHQLALYVSFLAIEKQEGKS